MAGKELDRNPKPKEFPKAPPRMLTTKTAAMTIVIERAFGLPNNFATIYGSPS